MDAALSNRKFFAGGLKYVKDSLELVKRRSNSAVVR